MNMPGPWLADSTDSARDEIKRKESPGSFFYAQGRAIVLASAYFKDERLQPTARGGVARKHRHRMHLALFGQLMASFEYLSKETITRSIDLTEYLDSQLAKCEWIKMHTSHVLATRRAVASPGSVLIGPTQGWHTSEAVNTRYRFFFGQDPIDKTFTKELDRLWVLRHSVAHNAGLVTNHDAMRIGTPSLSHKVVAINDTFIEETFKFLSPIARSMVQIAGDSLLSRLREDIAVQGKNFTRDADLYIAIKRLSSFIKSRTQGLPVFSAADYNTDFP